MDSRILVGTESGLWQLRGDAIQPVDAFTARGVTALAHAGRDVWAIVDSRALWRAGVARHDGDGGATSHDGDAPIRSTSGDWTEIAPIPGHAATCLAAITDGVLIGTEQAHLLRFVGAGKPAADVTNTDGGTVERVESFDSVDGRDTWHTPWGDPADVRSIAIGRDGTTYVNVHVGGVVRSRDGGRSWTPTLDIDVDVHQVIAHPTRAEIVLVAAYDGFGISRDGGNAWQFITDGMHAHYGRAVAVSNDMVIVSMSTGPRGRKSALYRKPLGADTPFVRCADLPWFDDNVDTGCLAADGSLVIFGTEDGRVFRSVDSGVRWSEVAKGLPAVRAVAIG